MTGENPSPTQPRAIALALGGGAALGWAHLGVLALLREEGIAVGAVAGTSIGALAAVCLAADRLDVLEEIARRTTRRTILGYLDPHLARGAWLGGRRIARELRRHLGPVRLEDLPLPVAVTAADLDTATEVRLTRGSAVGGVMASMALPGLFRPVSWEGRRLIDGGMVANLPVAAARALRPGLPLVAVDLMSDYDGHIHAGRHAAHPPSASAVLRSAFLMMMARQTQLAVLLDPPDVTIAPRLGHIATGHFHRASELIALGRAAAEARLSDIRRVLADQPLDQWRNSRRSS